MLALNAAPATDILDHRHSDIQTLRGLTGLRHSAERCIFRTQGTADHSMRSGDHWCLAITPYEDRGFGISHI